VADHPTRRTLKERTAVPIPTDTIDKLEQTFHAISTLGAGLTEQQWKTHTDLPGWTVQDNLAHLIGTERSLQGLPASDHRPAQAAYVKNPIGEFNEREVDARRALSGADVLAEWNELTELRLATLRNADEQYFDAAAVLPTGGGTVADFLHIRVLDCWSHEQDMRRALDLPGSLDTASAAHTIDRLTRTLPIVIGKRAATPEGDAVTVHLTGPIERSLTYEVIGGRATQVDAPSKPVVATVRLDSDAFVTLALGRRSAAALGDRIVIEGDEQLGRRVADQLNMMI
jgi:uncharacterized protein (TIGR03083 family)